MQEEEKKWCVQHIVFAMTVENFLTSKLGIMCANNNLTFTISIEWILVYHFIFILDAVTYKISTMSLKHGGLCMSMDLRERGVREKFQQECECTP